MTTDPAICLPALTIAWRSIDARVAHQHTASSTWVDTYVIQPDYLNTNLEAPPYCNGSLHYRVSRPWGLPDGVAGPQLHWDGRAYGNLREDQRKREQWKWTQRVHEMSAEKDAPIKFIFDFTDCRSISCVNTLEYFFPSDQEQTTVSSGGVPQQSPASSGQTVPGRVEIPMEHGEVMIIHGVDYSPTYTDNVLVVVGLAVTCPWLATPTEVVSPLGWCYPLERFHSSDAVGMIFSPVQADRARCLTFLAKQPPRALPFRKNRVSYTDVNLGELPLSLGSLPGAVKEAIVWSNISTGSVLTYIDHHRVVQEAGRIILPGWMEQPTSAEREQAGLTFQPRFSLAASPVRPSMTCLTARSMDGDPAGSVLQRGRMTDHVPMIRKWNSEAIVSMNVQVSCTPAVSTDLTVKAWSSGTSCYRYVSERWAVAHDAVLTYENLPVVLVKGTQALGELASRVVASTVLYTGLAHNPLSASRFFVFRPSVGVPQLSVDMVLNLDGLRTVVPEQPPDAGTEDPVEAYASLTVVRLPGLSRRAELWTRPASTETWTRQHTPPLTYPLEQEERLIDLLAQWPTVRIGRYREIGHHQNVEDQVLGVRIFFYIATELLALATWIEGRPFDLASKLGFDGRYHGQSVPSSIETWRKIINSFGATKQPWESFTPAETCDLRRQGRNPTHIRREERDLDKYCAQINQALNQGKPVIWPEPARALKITRAPVHNLLASDAVRPPTDTSHPTL